MRSSRLQERRANGVSGAVQEGRGERLRVGRCRKIDKKDKKKKKEKNEEQARVCLGQPREAAARKKEKKGKK